MVKLIIVVELKIYARQPDILDTPVFLLRIKDVQLFSFEVAALG